MPWRACGAWVDACWRLPCPALPCPARICLPLLWPAVVPLACKPASSSSSSRSSCTSCPHPPPPLPLLAPQAVLVHQLSRGATQNPFRKNRGRVARVLFHPSKPFFFVATQQNVSPRGAGSPSSAVAGLAAGHLSLHRQCRASLQPRSRSRVCAAGAQTAVHDLGPRAGSGTGRGP